MNILALWLSEINYDVPCATVDVDENPQLRQELSEHDFWPVFRVYENGEFSDMDMGKSVHQTTPNPSVEADRLRTVVMRRNMPKFFVLETVKDHRDLVFDMNITGQDVTFLGLYNDLEGPGAIAFRKAADDCGLVSNVYVMTSSPEVRAIYDHLQPEDERVICFSRLFKSKTATGIPDGRITIMLKPGLADDATQLSSYIEKTSRVPPGDFRPVADHYLTGVRCQLGGETLSYSYRRFQYIYIWDSSVTHVHDAVAEFAEIHMRGDKKNIDFCMLDEHTEKAARTEFCRTVTLRSKQVNGPQHCRKWGLFGHYHYIHPKEDWVAVHTEFLQ